MSTSLIPSNSAQPALPARWADELAAQLQPGEQLQAFLEVLMIQLKKDFLMEHHFLLLALARLQLPWEKHKKVLHPWLSAVEKRP